MDIETNAFINMDKKIYTLINWYLQRKKVIL